MLFLIAFLGAAVIALVLWRAMNTTSGDVAETPTRAPARPRANGPDDDPEFLRQLDERVRRREDPPA
jgi:hypothetical protein